MIEQIKKLSRTVALAGALALGGGAAQDATAQQNQGPRWQLGTSIEYMPDGTREVPGYTYVDYDNETLDPETWIPTFPTIVVPEGQQKVQNELRHGITLHDTKNNNHFGFNYAARNPGIYDENNNLHVAEGFDAKTINYDVSYKPWNRPGNIVSGLLPRFNLKGRVDGGWTSNEFMFAPNLPIEGDAGNAINAIIPGVGYTYETYEMPVKYSSRNLSLYWDMGPLRRGDSTAARVAGGILPDIKLRTHLSSKDNKKTSYFYDDEYFNREGIRVEELEERDAYLNAFNTGRKLMSTEFNWNLQESIKDRMSSGLKHLVPSNITLRNDKIGRIDGIGDSTSMLLSKLYAGDTSEMRRTNVGTSVKVEYRFPLGRSKPAQNQF